MSKKPLLVIFLTVFIDLVGFGIIIPLSPYLAREYGASELQVGLLQGVYSLMQFLFSPFWGRLSDRFGRRPVILVSVLGTSLAHVFFALSPSFTWLLVARLLAGFFGGNISAASAAIADVTDEKERSKNMGLIGAAFGLGFIFGPVIGGVLGPHYAAYGAGLIAFVNFVSAYFFLKETKHVGSPIAEKKNRIHNIFLNLRKPTIGVLMIAFMCHALGMAHMESMLFLYVKDVLDWDVRKASYAFAFVGLMIAFTQGFLIRKLIPKFGERNLLLTGLAFGGLGILGIGFSSDLIPLAVSNLMIALGVGLSVPSNMGSISLLANKHEQGETLGVTQSLSALGRILGPISGGFLYQHLGRSSPFWAGGSLMLMGLVVLLPQYRKLPQTGKKKTFDFKHKIDVMQISEYQFSNLVKNPVMFAFFDLRKTGAKPFPKAMPIAEGELLDAVEKACPTLEYPIVIICETGALSLKLGRQLVEKGHTNVAVLMGGTNGLGWI